MTCKTTKLDTVIRLELEHTVRTTGAAMVAIRRVDLDDLLHDLRFWEVRGDDHQGTKTG